MVKIFQCWPDENGKLYQCHDGFEEEEEDTYGRVFYCVYAYRLSARLFENIVKVDSHLEQGKK